MWIGHCKEIQKLMFRALALCQSKGLTLETSDFESLYGCQLTLSTQLIKPNYLLKFSYNYILLGFFSEFLKMAKSGTNSRVPYMYQNDILLLLPCVKKIPPTSKSRLKGTNKKITLILGFLYPTKQIPLNELASTYNSNIRSELYLKGHCHSILASFTMPKYVPASMETQK